MFDLITVRRNYRLAGATLTALLDSVREGNLDTEQRRLDFMADLESLAQAAGLRVIEDNVIPLRRSNVVPLRGGDDGPRAA